MGRNRRQSRRSPASRRKTARPSSRNSKAARDRELATKRRGELAELAFAHKAASLGFGISKPYGDSERYDFILDADDLHPLRLARIPVAPIPPSVIPSGASRRAKRSGSHRRGTPRQPAPSPASPGIPITPAAPFLSPSLRNRLGSPLSRLHRVQVKCSTQLIDGLYRVNSCRRVHGRAVPYTAAEIDFFAAYIIPEDTWYILPIQVVAGRTSLLFRRHRDKKPGAYDQYREAWHLLRHGS